MLQCNVVHAVSKGVQQAFFWYFTQLLQAGFQENAIWFSIRLHFFFGGSSVAVVTVVVQTDDDTVTASCKLTWSISGLLFRLCQSSVYHE